MFVLCYVRIYYEISEPKTTTTALTCTLVLHNATRQRLENVIKVLQVLVGEQLLTLRPFLNVWQRYEHDGHLSNVVRQMKHASSGLCALDAVVSQGGTVADAVDGHPNLWDFKSGAVEFGLNNCGGGENLRILAEHNLSLGALVEQ